MPVVISKALPSLAILAVVAAWQAGPVLAQSTFDGTWKGAAQASGDAVGGGTGAAACVDATVDVLVLENTVRGALELDGSFYLVQGEIGADGRVTGFLGDDPMTGEFRSNGFSGVAKSDSADCVRGITMTKG